MIFFLMSFISFFALIQKLQQPLPSWASETRLLSISFVHDLLSFLLNLSKNYRPVATEDSEMMPVHLSPKKRCSSSSHKMDNVEESGELSVLDLPDLALDCILEKLSPAGLSNMSAVCSSLREKCRSDYLWERHMAKKWGKVVGPAAEREWRLYLASERESASRSKVQKKWLGALSCVWPISWLKLRRDGGIQGGNFPLDDSVMSWYQSLESGKFWFPAQVYNREHGHVGFMLSCYDAEVSYDCQTDSFHARYPPHGRRTIVAEEGVEWERLRASPVDTPAHELHVSDCLNELRPGDHIEIQWRRNKEFPYGWWYGGVGHLESCDGNERFCHCHHSDTVILEFKQYAPGSRWRRSSISRKEHTEEGSEADGFYGGIRKLNGADEVSKWKQLWPTDIME